MRRPGGIESMAELEVQHAANRGAVARRLTAELRPYRGTLLVALVFVLVVAMTQAAGPYLVSRAIDRDIGNRDVEGLLRTMLMLFVVYSTGAVAGWAQTRRVGMTGQRVLSTLRNRLFEQLQALPLSYFDKRPIGDLMSRLLSDVDTLNQFFSQGMTQLLGAMLGLVGVLVAMLALNVRLALACFTIIPVMLLTTWFFAARARKAYRKTRQTVGNVTASLQEQIVGVRQAQAFNRTDVNIQRFRSQNAANRDANMSAVGVTSAFSPAMDMLSTLATALVIGYGGYQVLQGQLSVGLLAAFLIYVQQFFRPVQMAASVYTLMQSALAGAERIYSILDETREPSDAPDAAELKRAQGHITFENVSFAYDAEHPVLREMSFDIQPGQTVALVGRTGAGKTTVANLIPRFYDATGGVVRVDGLDIKRVTRTSLRRQMAMVIQEPFLFSGSIADNIAYGRPGASREEIEQAARAVHAHEFIAALPKGYDSVLGESGATLSQGQRQLLAFARAVIADPRVLILDEATANIDTRTEALIQRALSTLLAGRTSVVIAHRLSTIRNADLILVIDAGRITERGTHDELMARNGLYAELYQKQFREPAPPAAAPVMRAASGMRPEKV
ncbi:ABC transporter ATP-binding protein [Vitiosangium sp. GDMCC 1.1324]|uniref:ABC transporter ATP-binding protein n=1 Tax=Vitiosangium sp. (strain GDMCC 1.1324) TaxID=2138576 RepID=UPI000D39D742|nr:ABC transporter ATP-binding protein [Vitiosangium sp. GDMCC 1.1324]PTL84355.1 ABC transporter ATP-binding protein [Vitiosangium sp. GDMCC 1.1324]